VTKGLVPATSDHSLPVHPTQLYEMLVGAGLLAFLLVSRKHQKFRGQIFLLFTFAYGFCRYLLEILRDDSERGSIPPSLPEHVLIPLGLAVFGVGYAIGFSKAIRNTVVQRVTQVLAFAPAVVAYVLLKPETFASTATQQYSTSQAVAVSTGFAASIAFAIFYKAALAHPETAMALNLPDPAEDEVKAAENEADEDEEEALAEAAKKPAKPAKAAADDETPAVQEKKPKKKKKKVKVEEDTTEDADKRPVKDDTTEEA
jgi:phosphatidylglycerol:prolipoprotein diacylglycerol transferase